MWLLEGSSLARLRVVEGVRPAKLAGACLCLLGAAIILGGEGAVGDKREGAIRISEHQQIY